MISVRPSNIIIPSLKVTRAYKTCREALLTFGGQSRVKSLIFQSIHNQHMLSDDVNLKTTNISRVDLY